MEFEFDSEKPEQVQKYFAPKKITPKPPKVDEPTDGKSEYMQHIVTTIRAAERFVKT